MFFERHEGGERAILVHLLIPHSKMEEDAQEFELLAHSAGVEIALVMTANIRATSAKYFIGKGKVDEITSAVKANEAEVVLFNCMLSPTQERNLESVFECRVVDRTAVILDIFAQRARTFEGKLQVELAQLQHLSTRLIRGWTHLERQKGGIGLRGPGETQLETDRRLVRYRISALQKRLEKVRLQRDQSRKSRQKADVPTIALVGYTNAGKSTLFNWLTDSNIYAADVLFATLDPTLRKLSLPDTGSVVLADTVGFIRHLPHHLVKAFRATLEETRQADLLLHVVDLASDHREEDMAEVNQVLSDLGAGDTPTLLVCNKIDIIEIEPRIDLDENGQPWRVWISAQQQQGKDELFRSIAAVLCGDRVRCTVRTEASMGQFRALLYENNAIVSELHDCDGSVLLEICIERKNWQQILKRAALVEDGLNITYQ